MIKKSKNKSPFTITFNNIIDFNDACDKKDINLLNPITDYIIENYKTKKPVHKVLSVEIKNIKGKYNIRLQKELFKNTLQDFLNIYLNNEHYEMCNKISKVIENE